MSAPTIHRSLSDFVTPASERTCCKAFALGSARPVGSLHGPAASWFATSPSPPAITTRKQAMIEYIEASLAAQAGGPAKVIEGTVEPAAATAPAPKPKNRLMLEADTAVGPRERTRKCPQGGCSHDWSPRRSGSA